MEFEAKSTDFDGSITDYEWSFGDGSTGSGEMVEHTYSSPGTYTVKLTVTDNKGGLNSIAKVITVEPPDTTPQPPTVTTICVTFLLTVWLMVGNQFNKYKKLVFAIGICEAGS